MFQITYISSITNPWRVPKAYNTSDQTHSFWRKLKKTVFVPLRKYGWETHISFMAFQFLGTDLTYDSAFDVHHVPIKNHGC